MPDEAIAVTREQLEAAARRAVEKINEREAAENAVHKGDPGEPFTEKQAREAFMYAWKDAELPPTLAEMNFEKWWRGERTAVA